MANFEELFGKRSHHMRMGLERTQKALQNVIKTISRPLEQKALTILVGGTNGKGSTCGFLCQLFESAGFRTGLYSSPHIVDYRERFFVPSQGVSDDEILQVYQELKHTILPEDLFKEMSFFELSTLIAYCLFEKRDLDVVIFEVGLGGRLDSTNALDPHISAVCSIDLDHQDYLGDNLTAIAKEKAAIRRKDRPFFWGESKEQWASYQEVMDQLIEEKQPLYYRGRHFHHSSTTVSWQASEHQPTLTLSLPQALRDGPEYLRRNMVLAWGIFQVGLASLSKSEDRCLQWSEGNLSAAVAKTTVFPPTLIGRAQNVIWHSPSGRKQELYLDAAHNPAGMHELCRTLRQLSKKGKVFKKAAVTILRDKSHAVMLDQLRELIPEVLLFQVPGERSITREDLATRHRDLVLFKNFSALLKFLTDDARGAEPLLICGSIYGLGEVLRLIGPELRPGE